LSYVAQKIREETQLKSQIDVIRGFENLNDARVLLIGGEGKKEYATFFGNPNLLYNKLDEFCLHIYNADFGIGFVSPHDRGLILLSTDRDDYVYFF
jgi:hypothetical protein